MKLSPIDLMHARFGRKPGKKCGDCPNMIEAYYGDRKVRKCRVYGGMHSSKADWALKRDACGLFDAVALRQLVSDGEKSVFMRNGEINDLEEVPGQIGMED